MKVSSKIYGIIMLSAMLFVGCNNQSKQKSLSTKTTMQSEETKSLASEFVGTYISGQKEDGHFWVEVEIADLGNDSCKVVVNSKELKGRECCSFSDIGKVQNDTIFLYLTDWKRPVTAIITKKDNDITFDVIEKEDGDRYVLNFYCCGGGSLMGDYSKK